MKMAGQWVGDEWDGPTVVPEPMRPSISCQHMLCNESLERLDTMDGDGDGPRGTESQSSPARSWMWWGED